MQVILDADIVRPSLNEMGSSGGGSTGIAGGATDDQSNGFGPVALYVGGTAEVRFKDVAFKDLRIKEEPAEQVSSNFRMQRISDFYYGWSAAAADFNHDGILDIAAGPYIYLGPDYTEREEFTLPQTFNPSTQYASGMINFAYDFTGDGWPDILMTDSRPIYLYVNPKGESRRWDKYMVLPNVTTEEVLFRDIDGDGKPEVVYGGGGRHRVRQARSGRSHQAVDRARRLRQDHRQRARHRRGRYQRRRPHGHPRCLRLVGAARRRTQTRPWTFHPAYFGRGGAEMCVYDVNGDGLNDVVTSLEAHGWGVSLVRAEAR